MIGLILDDQSFEQDIRELLMAFYPGEGFVHQESQSEEYHLLVRGRTGDAEFELKIQDFEKGIVNSSSMEVDFTDRFETKNRIKRMLYGMVKELTGIELPWGTLTGIRPTKIAMTKLMEGYTD